MDELITAEVTTLPAPQADKFQSHYIMSLPVAEHKDGTKLLPTTSSNISLRSSFTSSHIVNLKENDKMQPNSTLVDDPRTLQLALELSMVGLSNCDALNMQNFSSQPKSLYHNNFIQQQQEIQSHPLQQPTLSNHQPFDSNALSVISAAVAAAAATQSNINNSVVDFPMTISSSTSLSGAVGIEERSKKSQNMTECVPVPSSEHVAEIVGRQGCKIKALRAKTNTYIKTPVRNEEPVFVVTGRKEDVAKAKREIISAAEHFSFIRASRKNSLLHNNSNNITIIGDSSDINTITDSSIGHGRISLGPPVIPGQITIQVRVPYRVVGLVVGPKGATIKHIQQETHTYIVTPSREKEPIFEVTGLPDNVQSARKHIEAHIALRTGSLQALESNNIDAELSEDLATVNFTTVHNLNTLSQIISEESNKEFMDSFYKSRLCSGLEYIEGSTSNSIFLNDKSGIEAKNLESLPSQILTSPLTLSNCNIFPKIGNTDVSNTILTNADNCNASGNEISQQREFTTSKLIHKKQADMLNDLSMSGNSTMNANPTISANAATRSCSSASSTASSKSANNSSISTNTNCSRPELLNFWKNLANSLDVTENTKEHSNLWNMQAPKLTYSTQELPGKKSILHSTNISPTDSLLDENTSSVIGNMNSNTNSREVFTHTINSQQHKTAESASSYLLKCVLCNKKDVVANRLACGHTMFCKDCSSATTSDQYACSVCNNSTYHNMYTLP